MNYPFLDLKTKMCVYLCRQNFQFNDVIQIMCCVCSQLTQIQQKITHLIKVQNCHHISRH